MSWMAYGMSPPLTPQQLQRQHRHPITMADKQPLARPGDIIPTLECDFGLDVGDGDPSRMPDYYRVLHVDRRVEHEELWEAYQKKCLLYNPDKKHRKHDVPLPPFELIQEAWETLSDPRKRGEYDKDLVRERIQDLKKTRHHGFPNGFEVLEPPLSFSKPPWAEDCNETWRRAEAMALVPGRVQKAADALAAKKQRLEDLKRETLSVEMDLQAFAWREKTEAAKTRAQQARRAGGLGAVGRGSGGDDDDDDDDDPAMVQREAVRRRKEAGIRNELVGGRKIRLDEIDAEIEQLRKELHLDTDETGVIVPNVDERPY